MLFGVQLFIFLLLGIIAFQDFRERQISWLLLPVLFISFSVKTYSEIGWEALFSNLLFNIGFIVFQLLLLSLWISIKNRKLTNIIDTYLGLGDILFFAAICNAFTSFQFLVFYVVSIVITVIGFLIYKLFSKNSSPEIPLAGSMAAVLIIFLIFFRAGYPLSFYN
jgi:hypothetical protein